MKLATLDVLPTPCLVLDKDKLLNNIAHMQGIAAKHGVRLRPHLKTCKSVEIAALLGAAPDYPITVSTLTEAEYFASAGYTDILYAVTMAASRMQRLQALYQQGVAVKVILDALDTAKVLAQQAQQLNMVLQVMIEIDTDGHRAGIEPYDAALPLIAQFLQQHPATDFCGLMTHAGESYACHSLAQIVKHAEQERALAVAAAQQVQAAGVPCPTVSVGSTPTALCAQDLSGVSELRAGVFVFYDLFQAGLGVCQLEDISLSVLTTVLAHKKSHNRLIIDAGGLALSKDRSTALQAVDYAYGLVCHQDGQVLHGIKVNAANQEHGVIDLPDSVAISDFPVGSQLRILPNHSCMTAAAYRQYHVVAGDNRIIAKWQRCNGW